MSIDKKLTLEVFHSSEPGSEQNHKIIKLPTFDLSGLVSEILKSKIRFNIPLN